MRKLCFWLFGKFTATGEGQTLKGLEGAKEQELLSYLLIHRNRTHSREALAALLWSDSTTDKSKKYLRQTLWHLQSVLDSKNGSSQLLLVDHDWLKLNPESHVWSDVAEFEAAFAAAEGIKGARLDSPKAEALTKAVELYQDDLLSAQYQDWIIFDRERLQNTYLLMLDKLVSYAQRHQQYEIAQGFATIILKHDPARERTHRQMMNLHYLAGDRTSALRQYERCVATLREELDVEPELRTIKLYQQIRSDQADPNQFDSDILIAENESHPQSPDMLSCLKRLQTLLSAVQRRITRDIEALEKHVLS